jgi:hypothetical protein
MKSLFPAILLSLLSLPVLSQRSIIKEEKALELVERCLQASYGFDFEEAHKLQEKLAKDYPSNPAPYFLNALLIYWEHFPLLPGEREVADFEASIETSIQLSDEMMQIEENYMEGVFFDMHARAFRGMFWADNGKAGKVLTDLDNMYRNTMKGIDFKEEFNEFYFSSGLYNYYIEAYVDLHPIYKPVAGFFRKGDKELGLIELQLAIDNSIFIKYEAILFMALLQLNYEKDIQTAESYLALLYNNFPDNIYYHSMYLVTLLHMNEFIVARLLSNKLKDKNQAYPAAVYQLTLGFLAENETKDLVKARKHYWLAIENGEELGAIADLYVSMAYAGLSRINRVSGNTSLYRKYLRESKQHSAYEFIRDYEGLLK